MTRNEIAVVITRAAKATGATVDSMMTGETDCPSAKARRLAFYYLFTRGHTIESITAMFKAGEDTVRRGIYKIRDHMGEHKAELAAIDGREG